MVCAKPLSLSETPRTPVNSSRSASKKPSASKFQLLQLAAVQSVGLGQRDQSGLVHTAEGVEQEKCHKDGGKQSAVGTTGQRFFLFSPRPDCPPSVQIVVIVFEL